MGEVVIYVGFLAGFTLGFMTALGGAILFFASVAGERGLAAEERE